MHFVFFYTYFGLSSSIGLIFLYILSGCSHPIQTKTFTNQGNLADNDTLEVASASLLRIEEGLEAQDATRIREGIETLMQNNILIISTEVRPNGQFTYKNLLNEAKSFRNTPPDELAKIDRLLEVLERPQQPLLMVNVCRAKLTKKNETSSNCTIKTFRNGDLRVLVRTVPQDIEWRLEGNNLTSCTGCWQIWKGSGRIQWITQKNQTHLVLIRNLSSVSGTFLLTWN
ncbi:MAG: hypothetical protein J0L94_04260 [Rhodothermia bacterium]|nr:hypothetical protein [Rhodothermia bacterium]